MGRYRSFTVRPPKPSFTKRAIERWTVQLISHFGDRSERRDDAANWVGVSTRTVDAWCSASDPRVISADMLMELAGGATINQASIMEADQIYDVVNDGEIITTLRDGGHAAYIADLRGYEVVRRDGKPVRMTEEQQVRSRLRKIIGSGHLTLRQISQWVGGDEYAVVDRIMEVRSRTHKNLYDFAVDRIDREIKYGYDAGWDWVGAAA
ncbi:hypothetical protein [Rhizobium leguminosarum]|uniref:hypothetical protein n=1 Tax=Rhizobium leguminosarum TaxID=384 RepID=UPI001030588E|nr:hypothetical protein [Rhizobium leguminosarum]TAW50585.1 hypothetical protein ELI14_03995 [Rhizobium leguminosarum]